jgi:hypothetical protein
MLRGWFGQPNCSAIPGLSNTDVGSKLSTLLYKLPTHPAKELAPKSFTMDPNGMVRKLKMKSTKSPLSSVVIIFSETYYALP